MFIRLMTQCNVIDLPTEYTSEETLALAIRMWQDAGYTVRTFRP